MIKIFPFGTVGPPDCSVDGRRKRQMAELKRIRKKANTYFFAKVIFNFILICVGALLIALFLRRMQSQASLRKQSARSEKALAEAVEELATNARDIEELTYIYHESNQDMTEDLSDLLNSGLFSFLAGTDTKTRAEVFADIVARSGVDYLYILGEDGKILVAPNEEFFGVDPVQRGLLTRENEEALLQGTKRDDGSVVPVLEHNEYGSYYFYSLLGSYTPAGYRPVRYAIVLGANSSVLGLQLSGLEDIAAILSRSIVGNGGFLFAVDKADHSFLFYKNGSDDLTGKDALEAGMSLDAFQDGYSGIQTIHGVRYLCVSKEFEEKTVVCAVAEEAEILANDRHVLFWSITGFVLVMLICLIYAVIVRNDFVRKATETKRKTLFRNEATTVMFDISVFKKVFPLMIVGVLLIFFISFYTQTLLELSEGIDRFSVALNDIEGRYTENMANREIIEQYYNHQFLSKARLISYLIGEDPSALNEESEYRYSTYNEAGMRVYLTDDEGNRLKSIPSSPTLQRLCDTNSIASLYIYDENGRTIATNTPNWYFTVSRNEADQSHVFLKLLDGRLDELVQEERVNDLGETGQYIGVAFHYYTSVDENGATVYRSRYDYESQGQLPAGEAGAPITEHRSMLQIGLDTELSSKLLASTDLDFILSSSMLKGGYILLFDATPEHRCLYSPLPSSIGMTAEEMGVSGNAFSGMDYYGFSRVNGTEYYTYFRYSDGYFIATILPKSEMFQARTPIALITAAASMLLILFLLLTVTVTTKEEEYLYATMSSSDAQSSLDAAIFNVILPSGRRTSTTKAAARWSNRWIPWSERGPEQKLMILFGVLGGILILYVVLAVAGAKTFFSDNSIIQYILSGNWDRGLNIFAFSACALVLIFAAIAVGLLRFPVMLITSLLGTRSETIGHLLLSVVKYGGTLGAIFYCLFLLGLDATSLLASAGILSLVIGLGAQSLIKDILAGIFIVFEGEFRVGDIVTINDFRGTVMDIGLRTTKIMGVGGNIKIYNNSDISGVLNMTKEASIASCTISIEYGQDIDYVEAVLRRDLPKLREKNPKILEDPEYLGVSNLGSSGVDLLIICKCSETDIKGVIRYLNREILQIFYRNGINVPFPNVTYSQLNMEGRKTIEDFAEEEEAAKKD